MKLYQYKPLNMGFVIICPDTNPSAIRVTANSIKRRYDGPIVAAVCDGVSEESLVEMNKICPTFRGEDTITSLINKGMDNARAEWNMTVMAGTWVRNNLDKKYSQFVESNDDILYAIVDGFYEFPDCSLNGIMIHRESWAKSGHFCPKNPLPICKLMWAQDAISRGAQFKGIIGVKMI